MCEGVDNASSRLYGIVLDAKNQNGAVSDILKAVRGILEVQDGELQFVLPDDGMG